MKYLFQICMLILLIIYSGCEKRDKFEFEDHKNISEEPVRKSTVDEVSIVNKPLITITRDDIVRIMVRADGAPGMYLGDDSNVHGFYVDLERMIMEQMEQKYEFISYTDVGPAVHALKTGTSHIALSVPDLPDYRSFLNLSIHFETLNYVTFVQNDNSDIKGLTKEAIIESLHGKKVGVQTQGHIYQVLRDIKQIDIIEYPTTTKALEDLSKGKLDAVPDVKRIGEYYSKLNDWKIKPVGKAIISHEVSTGFSQIYDLSFVERYNSVLKKLLDNGSVRGLWESHFGSMGEEDKPLL